MLRYCGALSLLLALGACSYKAQKLDLDVGTASTLLVDKDSANADGVEQVKVTLSLKHYDGTPAPGLSVQLRVNDANDTLVAGGAAIDPNSTLTTDANGRVTASFTSKFPGVKVLTSTLVNGSQLMPLRTASVTFSLPSSFPRLYVDTSNASPTAGEALSVTLTVVDAQGTVQRGYLGTVLLSASDPNAVIPDQVVFAPGDAGTKVVQGVVFKGAGTRFLTGTDATLPALTNQARLVVQPAAVAGFQVTVSGSPTAGQAAGITVTAVDAFNNIVPTYVGQVTITANDPNNTNGGPATAGTLTPSFSTTDQGQINLPGVLTLQRTNNQVTLTVTGPNTSSSGAPLSTTQGPFNVLPAAADHLALSLDTNRVNAGGNVVAQVAVQDVFNNLVTTYAGTVRVTSSDARTALSPSYTFDPNADAGRHSFTVTLTTANPNAVVTAQDANGAPPSAASAELTVLPVGPYLTGTWTSASTNTAVAGSAQTLTVRAYNLDGTALASYNGTVALASTDPNATLGGPITLSSGVGTANNVVHTTAGAQYVTLADTQNPNMAGTAHVLTVTPGPAAGYVLAGGNAIAGTPFPFSITAKDAYGNTATSYTGRADLTTTDTRAVLVNRNFNASDAGVVQTTMLFKTAGVQVVNANDSVAGGAITGSLSVKVAPGAPGNFVVHVSPSPSVAGQAVSATVDVRDSYGNSTPSYAGTLTWRTTNANAVLPPDYTFTAGDAGSHTFANGLLFYSASTSTVQASDTNQSTLNGSAAITVNPNVPTQLALTGPGTRPVAGVPFQVTLAATDAYGNTTPNVSTTVHYSSDDPNSAGLPADAPLSATGQQTNTIKLFTAGARTLNASALSGSIAAASLTFGLNPGDPNVITFTNPSANYVAGQPLGFTANVKDAFGNSATGYTGTVLLTSTDAAFVAGQYTFTRADLGSHGFTNTLHTAGNQNVLVQDSTTPTLKGVLTMPVSPAAASSLTLSGLANAAAGIAQTCTVTASDPYGNRATGYAGRISFSSTDPNAVLPANYTFVPANDQGRRTFTSSVVFKTTGSQTLTAGDGAISGTATVTIRNAPAAALRFSGTPTQATAGTAFSAVVTAYDAYNNVATDFVSTVSFTASPSGGSNATLPAAYGYTATDAGAHSFSNGFALNVVPSMTVTATSSSGSPITGSVTIAVQATDANGFVVSGIPANPNAGATSSVTVKAIDRFGNPATRYTGTIAFSSNDNFPQTVLPGNYTFLASDGGVFTAANGVTLTKAQSTAYVRVTDVSLPAVTGAQTNIVVKGLKATQLLVSGVADPSIAGVSQTVLLSTTDMYTNVDASYSNVPPTNVLIQTGNSNDLVPAYGTVVFSSGMGSMSGLQLRPAGSRTVRAVTSGLATAPQTVTVVANPNVGSIGFDPNSVPTSWSTCAMINPAVRVLLYDNFGNVTPGNANSIQMAAQNGNIFGTLKQPASGGVATFNDLSLDIVGQTTLRATLVGGTYNAGSSSINVSAASGAPGMTLSAVSPSGGCYDLTFTVSACGAPVFLQPRFSNPAGSNTSAFPATLATTSPAGLYGVPSARAITVRWDSVRDAGHRNGNYNFDIGAQVSGGVQGHVTTTIGVSNAPTWAATYSVPTDFSVQSLATADLNRDGRPDTVAVDGNVVLVWLGPSGGVNRQSLGAGLSPTRVAVGDINRDGIPDAVVCATGASNTSGVYTLLGQANGSLGASSQNALFTSCSDIVLADVNHDGFLDAITFDSTNRLLQWSRAYPQGSNAFGASTSLPFKPTGVPVAADFTGDGNMDVAVGISGNGSTLALFPGNGAGFGSAFLATPGTLNTFTLAAGDVDNNGTTDLVATNGTGYALYTGISASGIGPNSAGTALSQLIDNANSIRLADADGDGMLDLFVRAPNMLLVYAGAPGAQAFTTPLFSAALTGTVDFSVADLNRDGLPDLSLNQGTVLQRWFNQMPRSCDAATRFGAVMSTAIAPMPSGLAVADFDRDGKFDVFIAHGANGNNTLEMYRGDGAGGLLFKTNALGNNAAAQYGLPAAGDVTGDGLIDVAVPVQDSTNSRVLVFAGDGNGNFGAAAVYPVDPNAGQVVIADVNGDGRKDMLVTTSLNGSFDILLAPNFSKVTNNVGFSATRIVVGSVTTAKRSDVVLSNSAGFVVITNDGSGTLNAVSASRPVPVKGLVIADINLDGSPDIVVANDVNTELDIYGGDGSGAFAASPSPFPLQCAPGGLATSDLDRVNGPDLVVLCSSYPTGLALIYNDGTGNSTHYPFVPTPGDLADLAIRDMSSDGYPDVLALSQSANTLVLALSQGVAGNGNDFYGSAYGLGFPNLSPNTVGAALADFNGDGILDAVVGNSNTAAVRAYSGQLNGKLGMSQPFGTNAQPQSVCVADIDNDGDQDILAGDYGGNDVVIERNITARGASTDNFVPATVGITANVTAVAVADVNNDGKPDIVAGTVDGFSVRYGAGNGSVTAVQVDSVTGSQPHTTGLALGDLDGDGWADLAYTTASNNTVVVYFNDGAGNFTSIVNTTVNGGPTGIAIGDVDQDGKPDLVVALASGPHTQIGVITNQGSRNFTPAVVIDSALVPSGGVMAQDVVLADVTGDGKLDALVPSLRDYGLVVFANTGITGVNAFVPNASYLTLGSGLRSVAVGDINHDGRPDLLLVDDLDSEMGMVLAR